MFLNGFITIALLAAVAMVSRTPFVFPSLGPTAFLFFFTPRAPAASPGAVAILTLQAIVINRLAGIDYPLWALRDADR